MRSVEPARFVTAVESAKSSPSTAYRGSRALREGLNGASPKSIALDRKWIREYPYSE
jgi:hypothetical protein